MMIIIIIINIIFIIIIIFLILIINNIIPQNPTKIAIPKAKREYNGSAISALFVIPNICTWGLTLGIETKITSRRVTSTEDKVPQTAPNAPITSVTNLTNISRRMKAIADLDIFLAYKTVRVK